MLLSFHKEWPERFSVFLPTAAFAVGEGHDIYKDAKRENYVLDPAAEMHPLKGKTPTSGAEDLTEKEYFSREKKLH